METVINNVTAQYTSACRKINKCYKKFVLFFSHFKNLEKNSLCDGKKK